MPGAIESELIDLNDGRPFPWHQIAMWKYHPDLLAVPVPRYTSFPTAAEFTEDVGAGDFADSLRRLEGEVSLYVHIPFCKQICWYCGCNTSAAGRTDRVTSYLDALYREIALVSKMLPTTANVTGIAFGGGSPNSISPIEFVRLIQALTEAFKAPKPTISIELDPRTLSRDWMQVIEVAGISRASLGVQTFTAALQKAIGRIQPDEMIERSVEILRGAGVTSLNFDLMYGLPGQTLADVQHSLDRTLALEADRIALFGYAHVPHMIARQRKIDASALPDLRARFDMAAFGHDYLANEGYVPVGFDHFARPGDPLAQAVMGGRLRRNFQGFTEDNAQSVIGLGASAISTFPDLLAQNEKDTGRYRKLASQDRMTATRGVRRSPDDRRRAAIIEQLLCGRKAFIPLDLHAEVAERLTPFLDAGLCQFDGERLFVTANGLPYARAIAATFDPYRAHSKAKFSSAT